MDINSALLTVIGEMRVELFKSQATVTGLIEANDSLAQKAQQDARQLEIVREENQKIRGQIANITAVLEEHMATLMKDTIPATGEKL